MPVLVKPHRLEVFNAVAAPEVKEDRGSRCFAACCGTAPAVGPGARDDKGDLIPLGVKTGDRVLFGKWSGTEVKLDGEDLLIMKESDIMGVIEQIAAVSKAA